MPQVKRKKKQNEPERNSSLMIKDQILYTY